MEDKKQPIIVKRIKKGGHGHHGGAWKVAFADFVTAMMAFFMLMWLLGSVPQETLAGISDYFESVSLTEGQAPVPTQGMNGPGGASTSMIKLGGSMDIVRGEGDQINKKNKDGSDSDSKTKKDQEKEAKEKQLEMAEEAQLKELLKDIIDAIGNNSALSPYKDQLILTVTPEGLQIQIIDKENRPMFSSGGSNIQYYMQEILYEIAGFLNTVNNKVSVSGHTDASPFKGDDEYSNWELSADRANSARRTLEDGGLDIHKIGRVEGLASSNLFNKDDPMDQSNRRISILVMNRKTEMALTGGIDPFEGALNDYNPGGPAPARFRNLEPPTEFKPIDRTPAPEQITPGQQQAAPAPTPQAPALVPAEPQAPAPQQPEPETFNPAGLDLPRIN